MISRPRDREVSSHDRDAREYDSRDQQVGPRSERDPTRHDDSMGRWQGQRTNPSGFFDPMVNNPRYHLRQYGSNCGDRHDEHERLHDGKSPGLTFLIHSESRQVSWAAEARRYYEEPKSLLDNASPTQAVLDMLVPKYVDGLGGTDFLPR